jgi:hypothetical protein
MVFILYVNVRNELTAEASDLPYGYVKTGRKNDNALRDICMIWKKQCKQDNVLYIIHKRWFIHRIIL